MFARLISPLIMCLSLIVFFGTAVIDINLHFVHIAFEIVVCIFVEIVLCQVPSKDYILFLLKRAVNQ